MKQTKSFLVLFFATLVVTATAATSAQAQTSHGNLGLGFVLGSPTALSAKYFLAEKRAIDFGLAFSTDDYILIYSDYLLHYPGLIETDSSFLNSLVPYFGIGALIAFGDDHDPRDGKRHYFDDNHDDDLAVGIRIPFGVEWIAKEFPIGVALEIVPGIVVIPGTDGFINAGLALRYYF